MSINDINNEEYLKSIDAEIERLERYIASKREKVKKLKEQKLQIEGKQGIPWTEKSFDCIKVNNKW